MREGPKIELFGVDELDKFFTTLQRADQRRVIMDAFRVGGKPLISAAKQLLKARQQKKGTGNLNKSVGFVPLNSGKNSAFVAAKIGARRFKPYTGFHGHLLDAGTGPRKTSQGFNRGSARATRFFTEANEATENKMITDTQTTLLNALDKLINKTLPKRLNK